MIVNMASKYIANLYTILGLEDGLHVTSASIRKAYLKQVLQIHPDKSMDEPHIATKKFQKLQEAYEIFINKMAQDYSNEGDHMQKEQVDRKSQQNMAKEKRKRRKRQEMKKNEEREHVLKIILKDQRDQIEKMKEKEERKHVQRVKKEQRERVRNQERRNKEEWQQW